MFASLKTLTNILTNVGSTAGPHKYQADIPPFPQTPDFAKLTPALETKKEPFLLNHTDNKADSDICKLWKPGATLVLLEADSIPGDRKQPGRSSLL